MFNKSLLKKRKAFSLVELMITCIIIGVILSIAVPSYFNYRLRAEEQKAIATLYAYAKAQKEYKLDTPPDTLAFDTYASNINDLLPIAGFADWEDGDWRYSVEDSSDDTYTLRADWLDENEAVAGVRALTLDQDGRLVHEGSWPYTIEDAP